MTDPQTLHFMHVQRDEARDRGEVGSWIGARLPEGTVVSTMGNGAFSYRAGPKLVVVDALGLTDEHIARSGSRTAAPGFAAVSSDWDYVVDVRRPALIRLEGYFYEDKQPCRPPSPAPPWFPFGNPSFLSEYEIATFQKAGSGQWVAVYLRRGDAPELVSLLDAHPRFVYVPCPAT
ncbi:hypothetical protein [Amycolatopsis thermoflava]|uniref:hypothetical protein n=1 Tax=Amycolatopsis thermoflava TaxID=84480 RepID=UPI0011CE5279|nr:hypothetical protein [Amycolatopsis thermoflava]